MYSCNLKNKRISDNYRINVALFHIILWYRRCSQKMFRKCHLQLYRSAIIRPKMSKERLSGQQKPLKDNIWITSDLNSSEVNVKLMKLGSELNGLKVELERLNNLTSSLKYQYKVRK